MIRSGTYKNELKRQRLDHKKKQFAAAAYAEQDYPTRLNFYENPPTAEISLEDFEKWAIDRLRSMGLQPRVSDNCADLASPGRDRSLLVPQQVPRRNGSTPRTTSQETPSTLRKLSRSRRCH